MEKILFKDYPDTTTPIDAENLNTMQDNIENGITAISQKNIATIYNSSALNITPSKNYASTKLNLSDNVVVGNKLSVVSGGIKIGAGVSKIMVSGQVTIYRGTSKNGVGVDIRKNDDLIAYSRCNFVDWSEATATVTPVLESVQEDDIIYLCFKNADATSQYTLQGQKSTVLTVEVVE